MLKIIDVVKKIETENKYLEKVQKIEKTREERETKEKETIEYAKSLKDKRFGRTMQNKVMVQTDIK